MDKNFMRKEVLHKRSSMTNDEIASKSSQIAQHLFNSDFYKSSKCIMAYLDFRNEVRTEDIIKKSLANNKDIIVPISVVKTRELILSKLYDYDSELETGTYGILEPKKQFIRKVSHEAIDLVLIPGVAFDKRGFRVGYGAGYYDRFLSKLDNSIPKVALAFELQLVSHVNEGKYDIAVDYIVTENGIIKCRNTMI